MKKNLEFITNNFDQIDKENDLITCFENLIDLTEGITNALDFCTVGGIKTLLDIIQLSKNDIHRKYSYQILTGCVQNHNEL